MMHVPGLYILPSKNKGRGVFTAEALQPNDIIEICPIIKIPKQQKDIIHQTCLHDYYFIWEEEGFGACLALGYGSLYNHDPDPNATVILDYTDNTILIKALKAIPPNSEILIDYSGGIKGSEGLWFHPVQ